MLVSLFLYNIFLETIQMILYLYIIYLLFPYHDYYYCCNNKGKKKYECKKCGITIERDHNSAKNIFYKFIKDRLKKVKFNDESLTTFGANPFIQ